MEEVSRYSYKKLSLKEKMLLLWYKRRVDNVIKRMDHYLLKYTEEKDKEKRDRYHLKACKYEDMMYAYTEVYDDFKIRMFHKYS